MPKRTVDFHPTGNEAFKTRLTAREEGPVHAYEIIDGFDMISVQYHESARVIPGSTIIPSQAKGKSARTKKPTRCP